MELNIPMSVHCDGVGEVVFNDLTGNAVSLAGLSDLLAPVSLPDGNGYHVTFIGGNDGAPIRNPVTHRPHTHGAIPHIFRRGGVTVLVEGQLVVSHPKYRKPLADNLRSVLNGSLATGFPSTDKFRYLWTPPGASTRFREGKLYDKLTINGPEAAPKEFSFQMWFDAPEAKTYTQTLLHGTSVSAPNAGNTATFPVIKVYAAGPFTLSNGTYELKWGKSFLGDTPPILGTYIEIDMLRQTMYWDGNGANALNRLYMPDSDFWSIPAGGCTITCDYAIDVLANDGWVG